MAEQEKHRGEPVALPERKDPTQHWVEPGGVHKAEGWNACLDEIAKLGPLYSQPAPAVQKGEPVAWIFRELPDAPLQVTDRWDVAKHLPFDVTSVYAHADPGEVERLREGIAKHWKVVCDQRAEIESLRAQLAEAHTLLSELADAPPAAMEFRLQQKVKAALSSSAEPSARELKALEDEKRLGIERLPAEPSAPVEQATFREGDCVRKKSGSEWEGVVVGTYSTTLTPEGYCVESASHAGSVQIYPVGALERKP